MGVAQLVLERQTVNLEVAGSSPVTHANVKKADNAKSV